MCGLMYERRGCYDFCKIYKYTVKMWRLDAVFVVNEIIVNIPRFFDVSRDPFR